MEENTTQPIPTEPVSEAIPQVADTSAETNTAVPPSVEQPKKRSGLLWLVVIFAVAIVGWGAYFFYMQLQKPLEETLMTPPGLVTEDSKPDQGFGAEPSVPTETPALTSSDSVADIEQDLSGTTIESGNASEFDADLQSL